MKLIRKIVIVGVAGEDIREVADAIAVFIERKGYVVKETHGSFYERVPSELWITGQKKRLEKG